MTREEAKEFSPILAAFAEGKVIECRTKPSSLKGSDTPNGWTEMKDFEFWNNTEYRIKPAPKYRPFSIWYKNRRTVMTEEDCQLCKLNNICIRRILSLYNRGE